jgi:Na+/H+ antiporter NhaC
MKGKRIVLFFVSVLILVATFLLLGGALNVLGLSEKVNLFIYYFVGCILSILLLDLNYTLKEEEKEEKEKELNEEIKSIINGEIEYEEIENKEEIKKIEEVDGQ